MNTESGEQYVARELANIDRIIAEATLAGETRQSLAKKQKPDSLGTKIVASLVIGAFSVVAALGVL